MQKALIINESAFFKAGEVVEGISLTETTFKVNEHTIEKENFILLEKFNKQDEDQIRNIIRDQLQRFIWRLYSRQAFLVKEEKTK